MAPAVMLGIIFFVALLIGGNYTALKFALDHSTPLVLVALRTLVGGIFLMAFALAIGERLPTRRDDYLTIFIVSLCITTVSSMTLVIGVNKVPAGVAAIMASTMPLFTAVIAYFVLKERLSSLATGGLVMGFAGAALVASPALGGETSFAGIGILLIATLAWAVGTVMMKVRDVSRVSPVMFVAVQLLMSAAVCIPVALVIEGLDDIDWGIGLAAPLLYAAVPAMAITFALMATIIRHAPAAQAALPAYVIPVFGVLLAWLIRDERLEAVELFGGALVVAGVFVLSWANNRARSAAARPSA